VTFGHPYLLLTLLVLPLAVGLYLLAQRRAMRYAVRYTNLDVLASVAARPQWRRWLPPALFLLALAALCVGFARPHVTSLVPRNKATVILVIDVSRSMQATDVKPTRLGAAQEGVRTFLKTAPKGLRVALIAFAGEAQVAAPPTYNHELVRQAVDDLGLYSGYGGTAIGDALAAAVLLAKQAVSNDRSLAAVGAAPAPAKGAPVSILFLSDGFQTRGDLLPLQGAARAKRAGIPVYTIALGTPNGTLSGFGNVGYGGRVPVPPDPVTLRAIAQTTGGEFFAARSADALHSAYARLGARLTRVPHRHEVTYQFVAIAAGLLLGAGLLSAVWSPRLP
jgi:Ca-activated chloride channel family protein